MLPSLEWSSNFWLSKMLWGLCALNLFTSGSPCWGILPAANPIREAGVCFNGSCRGPRCGETKFEFVFSLVLRHSCYHIHEGRGFSLRLHGNLFHLLGMFGILTPTDAHVGSLGVVDGRCLNSRPLPFHRFPHQNDRLFFREN